MHRSAVLFHAEPVINTAHKISTLALFLRAI